MNKTNKNNENMKGFDDMKSNRRGKAVSIVLVIAMVLGIVFMNKGVAFANEVKVKDMQELGLVSAKDYEVKSTHVSFKYALEKGYVYDASDFTDESRTEAPEVIKEVEETITIDGVTKTLNEYCGIGNGNLPKYRWFDTKMIGMDYVPDFGNLTLEVEMNGFAVSDSKDLTYLYLRDTKDVFTEVYGTDGVTTEPRELMYIVFDKSEGKVEPVFAPLNASDSEIKTEWMYGNSPVEEMKEKFGVDDNYIKYELSTIVRFK